MEQLFYFNQRIKNMKSADVLLLFLTERNAVYKTGK